MHNPLNISKDLTLDNYTLREACFLSHKLENKEVQSNSLTEIFKQPSQGLLVIFKKNMKPELHANFHLFLICKIMEEARRKLFVRTRSCGNL